MAVAPVRRPGRRTSRAPLHAKRRVARIVVSVLAAVLALGSVSTLLGACAGEDDGPGVRVNAPSPSHGYRGVVLEQPYTEPDVTLTDTSGRPFHFPSDTTSPITLVFFGYTHCPDVCPTTVADITAALRRVPPDVRRDVEFVFITTDPQRDTPEVLRAYLDRFGDSYVGLTGPLATIKQAAAHLGVPLTGKNKLPSGGYEVGHGSQVIAFGDDGRARLLWLDGTTVGDYKHDLVKLAHAR